MIRLAIVIVGFNTREHLHACLRSLHEAPPDLTHAIVVVDNGSSDGSAAAVRSAWPRVQVVEMGRNAGFAAGTNAGIRACESELVLLLNSDTVVRPGNIDRLVAALERDAGAAAAGPRLVGRDGTVELSFGRMLSPWNEVRQKLIALGIAAGFGPISRWFQRRVTTSHYPDWVSGACLLVRRDAGAAAGWLTRGSSCTARTSISARRCAPPDNSSSSLRRPRSFTCEDSPAPTIRRPPAPPIAQSDCVLRKAPPLVGRDVAPLRARARGLSSTFYIVDTRASRH